MIYGYCRVSTKQQSLQRQIDNIKKYTNGAIIIKEKFTGTTAERPQFQKLLSKVKAGETIVFDSVSRMSRSALEGIDIYKELLDKKINLIFLKEPYINTDIIREGIDKAKNFNLGSESTDKIIEATEEYIKNILLITTTKQIEIAFNQSEKEVEDLRARIKEGIAIAKLDGKQIGTIKGTKRNTKKSVKAKEQLIKLSKRFDGGMNDTQCMKLLNISRNTFYKYLKELN